ERRARPGADHQGFVALAQNESPAPDGPEFIDDLYRLPGHLRRQEARTPAGGDQATDLGVWNPGGGESGIEKCGGVGAGRGGEQPSSLYVPVAIRRQDVNVRNAEVEG